MGAGATRFSSPPRVPASCAPPIERPRFLGAKLGLPPGGAKSTDCERRSPLRSRVRPPLALLVFKPEWVVE